MVGDLFRSPIARVIVGWHVVWGVLALLTGAKFLITLLNGSVLAIALGVVAAYLKAVWIAVRKPRPAGSDILIVGIWLSWLSLVEARMWSITWRALGQPQWLVDTDLTTHIISLAALAGLAHLAGPEAIDGRVPTRQWIRIGVIVTFGAMVAIGLLFAFGETGGLLRRG